MEQQYKLVQLFSYCDHTLPHVLWEGGGCGDINECRDSLQVEIHLALTQNNNHEITELEVTVVLSTAKKPYLTCTVEKLPDALHHPPTFAKLSSQRGLL